MAERNFVILRYEDKVPAMQAARGANATVGTPDPMFGTEEKVTTDFGGTAAAARTLAAQVDGKILTAGVAVSERQWSAEGGWPTFAFMAAKTRLHPEEA